jgi:hypothetical protein
VSGYVFVSREVFWEVIGDPEKFEKDVCEEDWLVGVFQPTGVPELVVFVNETPGKHVDTPVENVEQTEVPEAHPDPLIRDEKFRVGLILERCLVVQPTLLILRLEFFNWIWVTVRFFFGGKLNNFLLIWLC